VSSIVFWILAIVTVSAALAVVILRDVFRAALSLVLLFLAIAVMYITLYADFLAVVQVLIYVGAISILIIVAVMLTREVWHGSPPGKLRIPALIVSLLLLGTMVFTVVRTKWETSGEPQRRIAFGGDTRCHRVDAREIENGNWVKSLSRSIGSALLHRLIWSIGQTQCCCHFNVH
jgi:NADH-quinone oxidoreductase subunit J